jgi:hypothetical protein
MRGTVRGRAAAGEAERWAARRLLLAVLAGEESIGVGGWFVWVAAGARSGEREWGSSVGEKKKNSARAVVLPL